MSCETRPSATKAISLPVLGAADADGHAPKGPRAPHSSMGRRRAIVLGTIQLLMILHIAQWLWTGTTIKPIEPSESMETAKDGVITVGTVFFALALLSTAVLGRWFCGWGCHVVMLQDWCGHLMKKAGIRPRLFRSRLLLWLPLALAVYMFLWPVLYRFAIAPYTRPELQWPGFTTSFTTSDFWSTFPGWLMAVPFLAVCGFLTVYLLGAKGYCTYACPYGGFFAPLDELSPLRIRVSDACTQCGHCTAVCTSNVRVHEEVRDWKMVVDQGCMKCMDCVTACPEQALRVGWGTPAFLAKPVVERPAARRHDLTMNQELALAAVAVGSFFAVRGAIGVPLLFASGIAACATFLAWLLWRTLTERDVRLHRFQLKREGRVSGVGAACGVGTAAILAGLVYVGTVNAAIAFGDFQLSRVQVPPEVVFSGTRAEPEAPVRAAAERGRALYTFASEWSPRGPWTRALEEREAWLSAVLLDYGRAESILRALAEREGLDEPTAAGIARVLRGSGDLAGALEWSRAQWEANPAWAGLREELVTWLTADGRRAEALAIARAAYDRAPDDLTAMRRLSLLLSEGETPAEREEGLRLIDRTLEIAPGNPYALRARAVALRGLSRYAEAEADLRMAIELAPDEWRFWQDLGELLMSTDRVREGAPILKKAGEMRQAAMGR
ncbi:MAG: 4Fe-4S binding protein [Planctomycetaceae bacterium]|nr:4Fe-4S binding protein [Planctomycetaceae bacterium]